MVDAKPDEPADAPLAAVSRTARAAGTAGATAQETARRAHEVEREAPNPATHAVASAAEATVRDVEEVDEAAQAAEAAVAEAVRTDELLLDERARKVAAQVSREQPFGVPGRPAGRAGMLRSGFTFAAGAMIALAGGEALLGVAHELLIVLVAVFIAIGLDPAVRFLVARGMRRGFAVAAIVLGFLGAVAAFVAAAVPPIITQSALLATQAPAYLQQLHDSHSLLGRINLRYHVSDKIKEQVSGGGMDAATGILHVGTALVSLTFETVVVMVLTIYFLADLAKIKDAFYRLFPFGRRPRVGLLGDEIINRVGGYVLGNVLTSVVATVGTLICLLVLHVPYALVLAVLVGVMDLVPLVGSLIATAAVALVAAVAVSGTVALVAVGYQVLYRGFEDYLLSPRILRRTVDVSPVVTVIAVLLGGSLLGIVGALISVPVAAALQLLLTEVVYPQRDQPEPAGQPPAHALEADTPAAPST